MYHYINVNGENFTKICSEKFPYKFHKIFDREVQMIDKI